MEYIYAKGLFLDLGICKIYDQPNQWLPWDGISLDPESHNIFDELYEWGKTYKGLRGQTSWFDYPTREGKD